MFGRPTLSNRVARLESEVAGIRRLYDKTLDYSKTDPETALMNARKAAEAVCSRVFEHKVGKPPKSMTLQPLIERLTQLDAVPEQILIALRTIQNYGNFGSHHQTGEPQPITPEFAQPCLQSLGTVVRWYCEDFEQADQEAAPGIAKGGPSSITPGGWKGVPIWVLAGCTLCLALAIPFYWSPRSNAPEILAVSPESSRDWTNPIAVDAGPTHGLTVEETTSGVTIGRRRLAVLPFKPLSADNADTSGYEEGIVRILEKPLASSPDFELVERADIDKVIRELQLTRDRQFDQSTAARIGRLVGAQQLLLGSYFKIGMTLRIDARIVDTETGRILTSVAREGDPENLTALVTTIGEELATSIKTVTK
jgi:TolB-like protein